MNLITISGVMAATSCCIASFRASKVCPVWYPTVNRFLIRNSPPSTKRKVDVKCTLCCYRRPASFYKLLNNKGSMFSQPCHGVHWKQHVHRCSMTLSLPLYALPTRSYDPPKLGRSFCCTLYYSVKLYDNHGRWIWRFFNEVVIQCCVRH